MRIARKLTHLSQQEIADGAGVHVSFIGLLERGERDLRTTGYETVVRIADVFGLRPDELLALACIVPLRAAQDTREPAEVNP